MKAPTLMADITHLKTGDALSAFSFRKRFERIDWRKLASVDVNRVSLETDFQVLQDNIAAITFCDIDSEFETTSIDPNFIKIFKLAQLTIEYLLHSQDYLTDVITNLNEKLREITADLEKEKEQREKDQILIDDLKKENKKRRKMLENQHQQILLASGDGALSQCPHCSKAFIGAQFLQTHLLRRHPEVASVTMTGNLTHTPASLPSKVVELLELEIKELKEKLRQSENALQEERRTVKEYLQKEKAEVTNSAVEEKLQELENLRKKESNRHKEELELVKNTLMKELQELHQKHQASESALHQLQEQYSSQFKKSSLGELEDGEPNGVNYQLLEKQQDDISGLQEKLREQLSLMELQVNQQLQEQEKKWKGRMKQMTQDHAAELDKLKTLLDRCISQLKEEQVSKGHHEQWYEKQIRELLDQTQKQERNLKNQEKQIHELASRPVSSPKTLSKAIVSSAHEVSSETPLKTFVVQPKKPVPTKRTSLEKKSEKLTLPAKSRVQEVVKHRPTLLEGLKEELESLMDDKLESLGIKSSSTGITKHVLKKQLTLIQEETKKLRHKYPDFSHIREQLERNVNAEAEKGLRNLSLTSELGTASAAFMETRKSILKNATKPKTVINGHAETTTMQQSEDDQPEITKSPKKITFVDNLPRKKKMTASPSSSSVSEESETDSNDSEESTNETVPAKSTRVTLVKPTVKETISGKISPQTKAPRNGIHHEMWDSDSEIDEDNKISNQPYEPKILRVRPPGGQKVSSLAKSIEEQLSKRSDELPTGAVDIFKGVNQDAQINKSIKTKNGMYPEDDSDDYSISSVEDLSASPIKPRIPHLRNGITASTPIKSSTGMKKRSDSIGSAWDSSDDE